MRRIGLKFFLGAGPRIGPASRWAAARVLIFGIGPPLAMGLLLAFQATGAEIAPHEAKYDVSLESLKAEGFPLEVDGAMAIRVTRDCQKWEKLQEIRFSAGVDGGERIDIHTIVRTLEGLDGRRMEFTGWQSEGDGDRTNLKGMALMNRDGYGGRASFQHPEETQWTLPSPTKLQVAATLDLIDTLVSGQTAPRSIAFEVLGISEVTRVAPGTPVDVNKIEDGDTKLVDGRSWLVDRAIYFEAIARNEPFMYETLQIHENGVVSRFWQDYQTMILFGELVAITEIPAPDC